MVPASVLLGVVNTKINCRVVLEMLLPLIVMAIPGEGEEGLWVATGVMLVRQLYEQLLQPVKMGCLVLPRVSKGKCKEGSSHLHSYAMTCLTMIAKLSLL